MADAIASFLGLSSHLIVIFLPIRRMLWLAMASQDITSAFSRLLQRWASQGGTNIRNLLTCVLLECTLLANVSVQVCIAHLFRYCETSSVAEEEVCTTLGKTWHDLLLKDDMLDDTALSKILSAVAREMLAHPSSNMHLVLFGVVAGDTTVRSCRRCYYALGPILELATDALIKDRNDQHDVFARLAPLLLLRRLPVDYFSVPKGMQPDIITKHDDLLHHTCELLMERFEGGTTESCYAAEEKRLAIEIVGRSIPLGTVDGLSTCSMYSCIGACSLGKLSQKLQSGNSVTIRDIQVGKAALFASCIGLANSTDHTSPGSDLLEIARAASSFLSVESATGSFQTVLEQLQMGSAEFFALCWQKMFELTEQQRREQLGSISSAVFDICENVMTTAQSGESKLLGALTMKGRTMLWNSVAIACKRIKNDCVQRVLVRTVPFILSWSLAATTMDTACHAAALQVVVLTFSRVATEKTQSKFDFDRKKETISQVLRLSHRLLQEKGSGPPSIRSVAVRLCISVEAFAGEKGLAAFASEQDCVNRLLLLERVAQQDSEVETRKLAGRFISLLGC